MEQSLKMGTSIWVAADGEEGVGCGVAVEEIDGSVGITISVPPYDAGGTRLGSRVVR